MLQHDGSILPITALHLLRISDSPFLLAGEGSFVCLFDVNTSHCLAKQRAFPSQAVHGIISTTSGLAEGVSALILVWGGRSIRLMLLKKDKIEHDLQQDSDSTQLLLCDLIRVKDWVFDASFDSIDLMPSPSIGIACVTAHNELLLLTADILCSIEGRPCLKIQELGCSIRSILYSACVTWFSKDRVVIAAGTVFGEVLLWSCYLTTSSKSLEAENTAIVLHRAFTAHEGSIFGVQISSNLSSPTEGRQLQRVLATCSDDRTTRLWDISQDLEYDSRATIGPMTRHDMPSTGFLAPESGTRTKPNEGAQCIATAWGHSSRIWGVHFLPTSAHAESIDVDFISFGEDAKCQQWKFSGQSFDSKIKARSPAESHLLSPISTHKHHSGKSVWSLDSTSLEGNLTLVTSGGADGRISLFVVDNGCFPAMTPTQSKAAFTFAEIEEALEAENTTSENHFLEQKPAKDFEQLLNPLSLNIQDCPQTGIAANGDNSGFGTRKLPGRKKRSRLDTFRHYAFINGNFLFTATAKGRILLGEYRKTPRVESKYSPSQELWSERSPFLPFLTQNPIVWTEVELLIQIRSYITVASSGGLGLVFLASEDGSIYTFDSASRSLDLLISHNQKAGRLFVQSIKSKQDESADSSRLSFRDQCILLVTRLATEKAEQVMIERDPIRRGIKIAKSQDIGLPRGFIVTSSCHFPDQRITILGSRAGTTALIQKSVFWNSDESIRAISLQPSVEVHTDAIIALIDMAVIGCQAYVLRISRDGTFSILRVNFTADDISGNDLELVHHTYSGSAARLEGGYFDQQSGSLITYGFRGVDFVVFDETHQIEIMSESCGNGNREWTFEPESGILVYTRDGVMRSVRALSLSNIPIELGGGGREIKALAVQPPQENGPRPSIRLFATGSEDCRIRLFEYGRGTPRCLGAYKQHKTGIQHLCWSECGRYIFSSGGLNEFFIWRIYEIPEYGFGVVCEGKLGNIDESDIRITGFSITTLKYSPNFQQQQTSKFLITMINSISSIEVWYYQSEERLLRKVASTEYVASALLTEVSCLVTEARYFIITAASDGVIALWDFGSTSLKDLTQEIEQQSGVKTQVNSPRLPLLTVFSNNGGAKSMLIEQLTAEAWLLMLGGDDGSLKGHILDLGCPKLPTLRHVAGCRGHASALEAIAIIEAKMPSGTKNEFTFATTGADQAVEIRRLKLPEQWESPDSGSGSLELLYHVKSDVADPSSISIMVVQENELSEREQILVIAGVGIETMVVAE
jgi:WD40 repeat protein